MQKLLVRQVLVKIRYSDDDVLAALSDKLGCKLSSIQSHEIIRRSLDARRKRKVPTYILSIRAEVSCKIPLSNDIVEDVAVPEYEIAQCKNPTGLPPVVIGAGPAGLFAALELARAGLCPILYERGEDVLERQQKVGKFWDTGELDEESNVLYGIGGAGMFSDGKLTSRSKDKTRSRRVLETFVECGANPDILIDAEPHLGSDVLAIILKRMREMIQELGGEVVFNSRLDKINVTDGVLESIVISGKEIPAKNCVLAIGHSARDSYRMLAGEGVAVEAKPFAVGVRLEIPQIAVDTSQWGKHASKLSGASFRLTAKGDGDVRDCYSFCMCPGGRVIACASSSEMLTTNGMSLSERSSGMANGAFLVPVTPEDFLKNDDQLSGLDFQEEIERKAFIAGGNNYTMPAMKMNDFVSGNMSGKLPAHLRFVKLSSLREIFPEFIWQTLIAQLPDMIGKLKGVRPEEVIVYAPETRSSSPVRLLRGDDLSSESVAGLFPIGEGSGYAGGIMSSAIDGIKVAQNLAASC